MDLTTLPDGDLAALTRALHEARFPYLESDQVVWLAPFVVALHCAAVEEARNRATARRNERAVRNLDAWLRWDGHDHERAVVVRRFREDAKLRELLDVRGAGFLREVVRPFVLTDDDVHHLVRLIEIPADRSS